MSFGVFLHPKAAKFLSNLDEESRDRVKNALKALETSPEAKGKRLKPSNFWRLRIGDYRAIYEIDAESKRVIVLYIGHRRNVYDEFYRLT